MKIVINSQNDDLFKEFLNLSKSNYVEILKANTEKLLLDYMMVGDVSAFVLEKNSYSQKSIDFLKTKHPYIPAIIIGNNDLHKIENADGYIPFVNDYKYLYNILLKTIINYEKNFSSLRRLTVKHSNKIEFAQGMYDPNLKSFYYKGKLISKFSEKTGGIFEILAGNYGKLVKKDLILEKVWKTNDYFSSRCMDVYISKIRKIFNENQIPMKIKTISKSSFILE